MPSQESKEEDEEVLKPATKLIESRIAKLEQKVDEQGALLERVLGRSEEMHRYIVVRRVWTIIKILIIIVPIVLAVIYLPPLFEHAFAPYKELLNKASRAGGFSFEKFFEQYQNGDKEPPSVEGGTAQ